MDDKDDKSYRSKKMKRFAGLKFSQIKNCTISDNTGEKVGRLLDAIFKHGEDGLILTKFTVGGSRLEELMEDIGLKKDIDPVFPVELIDSISPSRIKLNVSKSDLKSTEIHDDAILPEEIKLSSISRMRLFDNENKFIGNIMDLKFLENGFKFIVGDGMFKELIEDLGWVADVDFLVQAKSIAEIKDNKIILRKSRAEMKSTFDRHIDKSQQMSQEVELKKKKDALNVFYPMR